MSQAEFEPACVTYCPYHERRIWGYPYYTPVIMLMGLNWLLRGYSLWGSDIAGGSSRVLIDSSWQYIYLFGGLALLVIASSLRRRPRLQLLAMAIGVIVYAGRATAVLLGDFDFSDIAHIWSDDMMAAVLIGASWPTLIGRKLRADEL